MVFAKALGKAMYFCEEFHPCQELKTSKSKLLILEVNQICATRFV